MTIPASRASIPAKSATAPARPTTGELLDRIAAARELHVVRMH
ncbi:MAG TPA: hypothetical protein VEX41_05850 [Candidatus Eisenbacteria bacterium]|nr:hypothetical protein [Candidatus Eisenbacteria bacterium]